jgi:hypothetical protein
MVEVLFEEIRQDRTTKSPFDPESDAYKPHLRLSRRSGNRTAGGEVRQFFGSSQGGFV